MQETTISVTDAARNSADSVSDACYQNLTFVVLKNGSPVVRLAPDDAKVCGGRSLAEALARVELPEDEAAAWRSDLRIAGTQTRSER